MNFRHKSLHFRHSKRPSPYTHKTSLLSTSAFSHDAITQKGKSLRVRNTYIFSNQKRKTIEKITRTSFRFRSRGNFIWMRAWWAQILLYWRSDKDAPEGIGWSGRIFALHIYVLRELHQRHPGIGETRK